VTVSPIRDAADGQVVHLLSVSRDITDRKRVDDALRASDAAHSFKVALADAIRTLQDPIAVQAEASRVLGERLGANRVVYFEIHGDHYVIERDYTAGVRPLAGRYPVASFGPAVLAKLLDGHTIVESDATTELGRPPGEREAFEAIQVRGHVGVPLVKGGQFVAGMAVHMSDRRDWSPHEVAMIENAAERTWAAVEQARVEGALRQSEGRLRLALSAARMVAWEYDPATGIVVTSENATEVYGFPPGQSTGSIDRGFAIVHPDDVQRHQATVEEAVAAGKGFTSQFRIVRPDTGAVQWMEEFGHAVRDEANGAVQLFGVNMDITARKHAERALRQSEERLAFVRRSSGVGFWYCDLPFDVLDWDDLVKAHFHLPPDAVVTIHTFYDRMHPGDREATRMAIDRSIVGHTHYDAYFRTLNPDTGAMKWLRAIGRTFYADDGSPKRFDGVTLDVTEQKQAEASLKESEQRRRLALDAAELGAWNIDMTTNALTTDERFRVIFSGTPEALSYEQAFAAIHPDDLEGNRAAVEAAMRPDHPAPYAQEYRVIHPDRSVHWVFSRGRASFDVDRNRLVSFNGTVADVTARKLIEEEREQLVHQLRDADRKKDEFLATLAHELRNPLAPMRSGLRVMKMVGADGTIEQARAMLDRQLTQMTRLVDDLLDVSRLTNGKLALRQEILDMREVITTALETSKPLIEQHGHQLSVTLPDEPVLVDGDRVRLAQVVSNLLTNSAKYTPHGGQIRLTVARLDGAAVLTVADDGIGIPANMLDAVFGMFAQVDRTLEKSSGGLGVGLSLVKGLVEMHRGTIEARSDGEGKGSEFSVRLPVATTALNQLEAGDVASSQVNTALSHRILIVDDNSDAANSLGQLLEMMGHEVLAAYDGASGIVAGRTFNPGVVLCDIGMPKMNGYDTARRIRAEEWGKSIALVALTGFGQEEDLRRSSEAGFDRHMVKPIDIDALLRWLADNPLFSRG
jgi:PAS domain S-box-containing protein